MQHCNFRMHFMNFGIISTPSIVQFYHVIRAQNVLWVFSQKHLTININLIQLGKLWQWRCGLQTDSRYTLKQLQCISFVTATAAAAAAAECIARK